MLAEAEKALMSAAATFASLTSATTSCDDWLMIVSA
jgi:hypothetical protein